MSRIYELSYKEIAEILEITPKTVENQISIALKFLKENFNKN
jgi:RNA polymerase sigma-70 factor (ECF subfamily)